MTITDSARSIAGVTILWIASVLLGWHILLSTMVLSVQDDEYTYILLVIPICAVLLLIDFRSWRPLIARNYRIGFVLLTVAALIAFWVPSRSPSLSADVRLSIAMFALVLWWVGDFVLWFGSSASRQALFPLCFFFGLVPLPRVVVDAIVRQLQLGSAWSTHALFWLVGVPVDQSGVLVTIPGLTIQVAQECSSIRSSSMLLLTTIVLAHLLLRSSWRRILLIGFAVPLSIAKNGLRIFTIAMLGTRVDPGYLTGRFHHQGGSVFFAVAIICIFGLIWLLRRGEEVRGISSSAVEMNVVI
jgi:exosortase